MNFAISILAALAALNGAVQAQPSPEEKTVAETYIAAYSKADWDGMAALMSEDVAFVDRTNPDPNAVPVYTGRNAVLAMLREFGQKSGVVELGFDFPIEFESNGVAVFSGRVNTLSAAPGADIGYRWRADQVIALTVRDGKVARHEDFADYENAVIEKVSLSSGASSCDPAGKARNPGWNEYLPFIGDWRSTSVQKQESGPDLSASGKVHARLALNDRAIEFENEFEDPFSPGAPPFVSKSIWMMRPGSDNLVGVAINSLGNRKFNEGKLDNGDLLITVGGEMFAGARQIEQYRYHLTSPDRIEVSLQVSADEGKSWKDGGYMAVYERLHSEGIGSCK